METSFPPGVGHEDYTSLGFCDIKATSASCTRGRWVPGCLGIPPHAGRQGARWLSCPEQTYPGTRARSPVGISGPAPLTRHLYTPIKHALSSPCSDKCRLQSKHWGR